VSSANACETLLRQDAEPHPTGAVLKVPFAAVTKMTKAVG